MFSMLGGLAAFSLYGVLFKTNPIRPAEITGVIFYALSILVAIVLIIGVLKKNRTLSWVWLLWAVFHLILAAALAIALLVHVSGAAVIPGITLQTEGTMLSESHGTVILVAAVLTLVFFFVLSPFLMYGIVVVCSYHRKLEDYA
ncbi:hypothetical protein Bbelb_059830 [Branchiostoma belcheri]|nr:hypothetical protein Bbelb_059830 [Branchiostoma belcheri]